MMLEDAADLEVFKVMPPLDFSHCHLYTTMPALWSRTLRKIAGKGGQSPLQSPAAPPVIFIASEHVRQEKALQPRRLTVDFYGIPMDQSTIRRFGRHPRRERGGARFRLTATSATVVFKALKRYLWWALPKAPESFCGAINHEGGSIRDSRRA